MQTETVRTTFRYQKAGGMLVNVPYAEEVVEEGRWLLFRYNNGVAEGIVCHMVLKENIVELTHDR